MRFVACGASVIGPRHIDLREPNQDAMGLTGWRGGWLASVADGLGSRTRSEIGSRRACQVVRRVLRSGAGQSRLITPERTGYSNQTWALEAEHRTDKWTMAEGKLTQPGDGVVLLTDGVADDLEPDQLPEFLVALYHDLSTRNRRGGRRWIQTELHAWATPMHSDDKTLVAVFRTSK